MSRVQAFSLTIMLLQCIGNAAPGQSRSEPKQPRTVFNDDAQFLIEAPEKGTFEFEVEAPSRLAGPVRLTNGHLLGIERPLTTTFSADGGRTWKPGKPLSDKQGKPLTTLNSRAWSLIRLASGAIAVTFETIPPSQGGTVGSDTGTFISKSTDEGKTWSTPVRVSWKNTPANPTWLVQTKKGRLILPNEYWRTQPADRGIGLCSVLYSDDEGQTWRESRDSLWLWEKDGAWQGSCEVPCVVETSDGRMLMFMRTSYQRIAQSESRDAGKTWSPVKLNALVSSNSEISLTRIPSTGDLLCVWNQASTKEIKTGYYRARLTSAISKDNGKTWRNFRTVVTSPGQETVSRITDTDSPGFLRTPMPVPTEQNLTADEFHMNRAPRVRFIDHQAYLIYTHRRYRYVQGKLKRTYNQDKLRVLPSSWFYEN